MSRLVRAAVAALATACAADVTPERGAGLPSALEDLRAGGFEFEADVRFRVDPYAVCEGIACAEIDVVGGRRTILVAPEAAHSAAVLRATLLEIWERYREPRRGSTRDLARGALRVVRDGARVGVDDPRVLTRARLVYGQLYDALPPVERRGLPDPGAGELR